MIKKNREYCLEIIESKNFFLIQIKSKVKIMLYTAEIVQSFIDNNKNLRRDYDLNLIVII